MARLIRGVQTALSIIFFLGVVAIVLAYLLQGEPGNEDGCRGDEVPDPRQGITCLSRADAIDMQATMEREVQQREWDDRYLSDRATEQAEQNEEFHRQMEADHEDAVRTCILAGNNADLCALDPDDPYGIDDRD